MCNMKGIVVLYNKSFLLFSDTHVNQLLQKMRRHSTATHIVNGEQLMQRRCVLEGVKEMYTVYRQVKWQQVQSCISAITQAVVPSANTRNEQDAEQEDDSVYSMDSSFSEDEHSFREMTTETSDSEDEEEREEDVFRSGGGYDMDTATRALCVDSCELYRGV